MDLTNIQSVAHNALLVILGGLFGWVLGKMPVRFVYGVMLIGILLLVLVMR
jgi:hypothetical protein